MFLAQSSDKDFDNMADRTDRYIEEYHEKLKNITQEEIDNICHGFIDELEAPSDSLMAKCGNLISNIEKNKLIYIRDKKYLI